jgi:hypothetical protein
MATLVNVSLNLSSIDASKVIEGKKGKYLNLTVAVNDETNDYGQNVSLYHSQTKEAREGGEKRQYLGNGKVVWTDGKVVVADRQEEPATANNTASALPF